ncbi:MAG TPA: hypothetical protein VEZ14_09515 [Dehalococcoidia bacterium]|nr:hypothetical protein [Dehalococcoidia bacterium]
MARALQDPRYVLPLCALISVTLISVLAAAASLARAGVSHPAAASTGVTDSQRLQDLASVRTALSIYREQTGVYPSTVGRPTTLCAQPDDAGCLLRRITRALPVSDGTTPYWYASDGLRYTLFARADAADAHHACASPVPAELAPGPVLCVTGGAAP